MRNKTGSPWPEIARIARTQHGVVTARQLLGAGMSRAGITRRTQQGLLHREYRGVYRVGHRAPSVEARYLAAVLACGEGAALSHHAAAHHLGLRRGAPPAPEVTAPAARAVRGVITHKGAAGSIIHRGIPTVTVPRTIVALAPLLSIDALGELCHRAGILHRTRPQDVPFHGAPGAAKLRAILHGDHPTILSRLESDFVAALRAEGLVLPQTNRRHEEGYVDCRWPGRRLTVELDSYRFHHSRHAWEQDNRRDRAARARGDEVRRYTWADVHEHRAAMLADLSRLLGARR
jgi:very-short-patch-repair endonuclease